jgi:drug/metabolite transporter (DMT)-like permease
MKKNLDNLFNWLMLILLSLIWGSSFILMKYGLKSFSYGQVAGFRMFIAFIALLPWAIKNLKFVNKKNILAILIVGYIGNCIPAFLFTIAETRIDSSLAGMLNAMTPFFTLIIGSIVYRLKVKGITGIGIAIGLAGSVLLLMSDAHGLGNNINAWALFVVLATLMYGININHVKEKLGHLNGIQISSLAFFFVGPPVTIYLLSTNLHDSFAQEHAWNHFFYILLLGLFGSAIAVVMANYLIQRTSAIFTSSVTYLMPIIAMGWGLFDNEKLSLVHYSGLLLILFGVYLANKKSDKK